MSLSLLAVVVTVREIRQDHAQTLEDVAAETAYVAQLRAPHGEQRHGAAPDALERAPGLLATLDRDDRPPGDLVRRRLDDLLLASPATGTIGAMGPRGQSWLDSDLAGALTAWRRRSAALAALCATAVLGFVGFTFAGLRLVRRCEKDTSALVAADANLDARVRQRTAAVELLFRELNHRVKNNLQMVAALIRLQARESDDPGARAALHDTVRRIGAIADLHRELDGTRLGSVELRSYVDDLVRRIAAVMQRPDQSIVVEVELPRLELSLDRAVPIGIIVNELVSNAFKHAFADRAFGRLQVVGTGGPTALTVIVRNDGPGGGTPVEGGRAGLGSRIVEMLAAQIGGAIEIDAAQGYAVTLRVPLDAIERAPPDPAAIPEAG